MKTSDIIAIVAVVVAIATSTPAVLSYFHVQPPEEKEIDIEVKSANYKIDKSSEVPNGPFVFHVNEVVRLTNKSEKTAQIKLLPSAFAGSVSMDGKDIKYDSFFLEPYKSVLLDVSDITPLGPRTLQVLNEVEKDGPQSLNAALRMIGLRYDGDKPQPAMGTLHCSKENDNSPTGRLPTGNYRTSFTLDVDKTRQYCENIVTPY